jgi:hypothetical protein
MNGDALTSVALLLSGSAIVRIIGPFVLRATLGRGSLATVAFDLQPVRLSPPGGHNRVMIIRKG